MSECKCVCVRDCLFLLASHQLILLIVPLKASSANMLLVVYACKLITLNILSGEPSDYVNCLCAAMFIMNI